MSRWYRAYEGTVTDAKLAEAAMMADVTRSVAVASWHALLESAAVRNNCGSYDATPRRVAVSLCEPLDRIQALFEAFTEIGLVQDNAVAAWKKRQYASGKTDGVVTETQVYVAGTEWDKAVKIGFSKNPWARAKELQTGNDRKIEILAHFKCSSVSEREIHELLSQYRHAGEWFNLTDEVVRVFQRAHKDALTYDDLLSLLRKSLRSATSPVIKTDTKTDTKTEVLSSNDDSPSGDVPSVRPEHVFEFYQKLASEIGRTVPRDFTPERRQLVRARLAQYSFEDFLTVFAKCRGSPFLRGDRDGRTPLTVDWLMQKKNFQKVLEGNYD